MVRTCGQRFNPASDSIASAMARASKAIPSSTARYMAARVVDDLIPTKAAAALMSGCGVRLRVR